MKARTKHYHSPIVRRRSLILTLRRFRVAASRRNTQQTQMVFDIQFFGIRQVVLQLKHTRVRGRPRKDTRRSDFWQPQVSLPRLLIVIGIAGSVLVATQFMVTKSLEPVRVYAVPPASSKVARQPRTLAASRPTHISINSVDIDADIIPVGLDAQGAIELPSVLAWQAGWYKHSPTPGELGPAIIVGHVDSYKGISVFWRLRDVQAGDEVRIARADGSIAVFTITALAQYDQHTFPTNEVYKNLEYAGLKLITCGGTFDEQTQHYTENTVMTAILKP